MEIRLSSGDKVILQYRLMNENDTKQHHETYKNFNSEDTHLEEFFFSICEVDKNYKELPSIKGIILTLSHDRL